MGVHMSWLIGDYVTNCHGLTYTTISVLLVTTDSWIYCEDNMVRMHARERTTGLPTCDQNLVPKEKSYQITISKSLLNICGD